jgi:hypothetical protein
VEMKRMTKQKNRENCRKREEGLERKEKRKE